MLRIIERRIQLSKESFITTTDNPFDFFNDFDNWRQFDEDNNYYTLLYIARIRDTYPESLDSSEEDEIINQVFDDIIELNLTGNYKRVYNNSN